MNTDSNIVFVSQLWEVTEDYSLVKQLPYYTVEEDLTQEAIDFVRYEKNGKRYAWFSVGVPFLTAGEVGETSDFVFRGRIVDKNQYEKIEEGKERNLSTFGLIGCALASYK
jgi:hypothetical protein